MKKSMWIVRMQILRANKLINHQLANSSFILLTNSLFPIGLFNKKNGFFYVRMTHLGFYLPVALLSPANPATPGLLAILVFLESVCVLFPSTWFN